MNSDPNSSAYEYLTQGYVNEKHKDCLKCKKFLYSQMTLFLFLIFFYFLVDHFKCINHSLKLISAYGTPAFTNYTDDFKGCLDYIFYQKCKMTVESTVPIPSEEELSKNVALPSRVYPSDHISLIADLKIK